MAVRFQLLIKWGFGHFYELGSKSIYFLIDQYEMLLQELLPETQVIFFQKI